MTNENSEQEKHETVSTPVDLIMACNGIESPTNEAAGAASDVERVVRLMIKYGFATGHADTMDEVLAEFDWQLAERFGLCEPEPERETVTVTREMAMDAGCPEMEGALVKW